jgi:O-antigen/teichoic acid export membrane protein
MSIEEAPGVEPAAVADAGEPPASIPRNTMLALAAQLITGLFTAALTLYLVRALGPSSFGLLALTMGIGEIAYRIAEFGIPFSTSRFLAENRSDEESTTGILIDGIRLNLITIALVTCLLFACAGLIGDAYGKPQLVWPLRAVAIAIFGQSVMMFYVSAFIGLGQLGNNLRVFFLESLVETVATIGLVLAGGGVVGATFGRAIGYAAGAVIATAVVAKLFGRHAFHRRAYHVKHTREIAGYAGPLFIASGLYTLYAQIDVLLVGAVLGTTAAGIFAAPLRLVIPLSYVGQAVANGVAPRQAKSSREPGGARAFQLSLRFLFIFQSLLLAPIIIWPAPIVQLLLGEEFRQSTNVLRFLALFIFLRGLGPLITTTVNYLGRASQRIPIVLTALGINVIIDLLLLPRVGVVGAAIGAGVGDCIYVPAHFLICRRELGLKTRPLALTLVRALLAAAAMGAVLWATGMARLTLQEWILGGLAGTIAFAVVLLLTRELSNAELRRLGRAVARMSRRTSPMAS